MFKSKKKRPQTLKQRIRSYLWQFLLEELPPVNIDGREFAKFVQKSTNDIFQVNANSLQKSDCK